jgi:RHS repeat-associated protein
VENATASACEQDVDYYPYGGEENDYCSTQVAQHYKFTGKERDSESGLDNFEARYMGSSLGRFMTPDPSNLSVDFWLPQTWNRYAYAVNNPLRFVDRNGLWPTEIHNQIISEAFPGLSADQIKTLQQASHDTDYGNINVQDNNGSVVSLSSQDPIVSYVHGMSDGTIEEDPGEAQKLGDAFIAQNEHGAEQAQADWIAAGNSGISPKALTAFGNALHTVTDRTSPAHSGNKPWYGWTNPLASGMHVLREHWINQNQMNAAVAAARNAYLNTFGWMALMNATQPKACVEAHDSSGQGTGTTCN